MAGQTDRLRSREGQARYDFSEALTWYRKAATRDDAQAQRWLGYMTLNGMGVSKNETEACRWYLKAAAQNDAVSQSKLGYMYEKGIGVKKDSKRSIEWYRQAAENGDAEAAKALKSIGK